MSDRFAHGKAAGRRVTLTRQGMGDEYGEYGRTLARDCGNQRARSARKGGCAEVVGIYCEALNAARISDPEALQTPSWFMI